MNYYERHLGDFAKDTSHLSALEIGVYDLLIDRYYASEQPIAQSDVYRVARARSKDEKAAVDFVLSEFFKLEDGRYHQKRIDEEIDKYLAKEPDRAKKKADAAERQRRARERRTHLFDELRKRGIVPEIKTTTADLERALIEHDITRDAHESHALVTRDNTLTQSPVTSHQSPVTNKNPLASDINEPTTSTPAGEVCARLLKLGMQSAVTPQHPKLLALLAAGLTVDEIVDVGPDAIAKGKGFAWLLAAAEGRRRDAAAVETLPAKAQAHWFMTASGIESKAVELGLERERDEVFPVFKQRVYTAAGVTPEMLRTNQIDAQVASR